MTNETQELKPENAVIQLNIGSIKFSHTKDQLEAECAKYDGLTVDGLDDKDGLKAVKAGKKVMQKARTCVVTEHKTQKAEALKFGRECDRMKNELLEIIEPTETKLKRELDKIKEEEERIAAEAQRKKEEKIKKRQQALIDAGATMTPTGFLWGTPPQPIPEVTVLMSDDNNFETLLQSVASWKADEDAKEAERQAKIKKAEEEEEARRKAQEDKERELREREAKIKAEEEKADREAKEREEKERQRRIEACINSGLTFDGRNYVYKDLVVAGRDIETADSDTFSGIMSDATIRMDEYRKQEESERQAENERLQKEAAEKAKQEERERIQREAEEKAEADRKAKAAAERKERRKPDKKKLAEFSDLLFHMDYPEVKTEEARDVLLAAKVMIEKASEYIKTEADKL